MLNLVFAFKTIVLSVIMFNVSFKLIMLTVIILSVIMLSVVKYNKHCLTVQYILDTFARKTPTDFY
jgi:hypothetical protein